MYFDARVTEGLLHNKVLAFNILKHSIKWFSIYGGKFRETNVPMEPFSSQNHLNETQFMGFIHYLMKNTKIKTAVMVVIIVVNMNGSKGR